MLFRSRRTVSTETYRTVSTVRYFSGVTDLYKQFGLLENDGLFTTKKAKWKIEEGKIIVDLDE